MHTEGRRNPEYTNIAATLEGFLEERIGYKFSGTSTLSTPFGLDDFNFRYFGSLTRIQVSDKSFGLLIMLHTLRLIQPEPAVGHQ